jgi:hypothetical protein
MNILVLEDRGSVSFYVEEALEAEGHKIFPAFNINDAQSYWEDEQIDCIIADLNMSPEGLKKSEAERTNAGILTGWVWLNDYVFCKKKEMRSRTVIYSEYLGQLREYVGGEKEYVDICCVAKRGSTSPTEELLSYVRKISKIVEREN